MHKLIVFHPSMNLVSAVDALISKRAPGMPFTTVVKENLLDEAIKNGITDNVIEQIENVVSSISTLCGRLRHAMHLLHPWR